ncbi:MAG: zinc metalloprotease HtpX [Actinobacteria bacterium]|nr:zinc metalloprotease HtpX [Actinomycetota bacterium]
MSNMRTWLLMGVLTVLLVTTGNLIGGPDGMMFMLVFAILMNFSGYWWSDKIATRMTRSKPVSEHEAPELYSMVRNLSLRAGLPMPRIYKTPSPQPNAFATGRNPNHAVVAVTDGLMSLLSKDEIEGVLAHELAHVKNKDILVGSMAAMIAGAISMLANITKWGLIFGGGRDSRDNPFGMIGLLATIIIMPIAALLVQMAISRSREYGADAEGVKIAGRPDGLVNALLKLERGAQAIPMQVNPAASHMFIVNPLSAGQSMARLFSTHPPVAERVARLRKIR